MMRNNTIFKIWMIIIVIGFISMCKETPVNAGEENRSSYASVTIPEASLKETIPLSTKISSWENSRMGGEYYKIVLPQDGMIVVNTTSFSKYQSLDLINENSETLVYKMKTGNQVSKKILYVSSGTYYLKYYISINPAMYDEGDYTFSVDYQPTNITISQYHGSLRDASYLPALKWNQEITGQFSVDTGCDYFKFQVSNDCKMKVSISSGVSGLWIGLRDENEKTVNGYRDVLIGSQNNCLYYNLGAGTYYFCFYLSQYNRGCGVYHFTLEGDVSTPNDITVKPGKKKMTITAGNNGYYSGYEIQYKQAKGVRWKTVKSSGKKGLKKTINKLKSGKKYKVKVRSYNYFEGKKQYSKWSATKTVKIY